MPSVDKRSPIYANFRITHLTHLSTVCIPHFYQQPHTGAVLRDTQIMVSDDDDQKARVRLYRPIYKLHSTQVIITITIIITVNTFIIFTTFDNVYATPLCTFLAVVAYHSAVYTI